MNPNAKQVLAELGLLEYESTFVENGFESLASMKLIDEDDLEAIGMKKRGHRKLMLKWIAENSKKRGQAERNIETARTGGFESPLKRARTSVVLSEIVDWCSINELFTYNEDAKYFKINKSFLCFRKDRIVFEYANDFVATVMQYFTNVEDGIAEIRNSSGMGKSTLALSFIRHLNDEYTVIASNFNDNSTFIFKDGRYIALEGEIYVDASPGNQVVRLVDSPHERQQLIHPFPTITFVSEHKFETLYDEGIKGDDRAESFIFPPVSYETFKNIVEYNCKKVNRGLYFDDVMKVAEDYGIIDNTQSDVEKITNAFWFVFGPKPRVLFLTDFRDQTWNSLICPQTATNSKGEKIVKPLSQSHAFCYSVVTEEKRRVMKYFSDYARIQSPFENIC
eukprot:TRINITY_DN1422_c0_g1_i2.p1 TRINITY_DN1422_c0_g1~~TRINITY_DN1422_c0_g1_i2.p1  ORF type:complete len:393 (+),score=88.42 TRINITY_DN1422_c0_g1_i2:1456-2634(+)